MAHRSVGEFGEQDPEVRARFDRRMAPFADGPEAGHWPTWATGSGKNPVGGRPSDWSARTYWATVVCAIAGVIAAAAGVAALWLP